MTQDAPLLTQYVIYDHPSDFPEDYVIRRFHVYRGRIEQDLNVWALAAHIEQARATIPPGLACIPRHPADDPSIAETWT